MKGIIVILMVLAMSAFATVKSGTSYRSDANNFDDLLNAVGVYTTVSIERYAGGYQYIAWFNNDYFSMDDSSDMQEWMAVVIAAAYVSDSTNWRSIGAVAVYEDQVVAMETARCRELVRYSNAGYSDSFIGSYLLQYSYVCPISSTVYPRP